MKKKLFVLSLFVLAFVLVLAPVGAFAQGVVVQGTGYTSCSGGVTGNIQSAICKIGDILRMIVPLLISLGVVYFVWGVITYVIASDEEAKKSGRDRIIYGIIGLAVIVAVWGLVGILTSTFEVDNAGETITLPTI